MKNDRSKLLTKGVDRGVLWQGSAKLLPDAAFYMDLVTIRIVVVAFDSKSSGSGNMGHHDCNR